MIDTREEMKIARQLEELRWKRPEVYDLIIEASLLPDDKYEEFMKRISPILKKYLKKEAI